MNERKRCRYSDGVGDFDGGPGGFTNLLYAAAFFADDLADLSGRDHDSEDDVMALGLAPARWGGFWGEIEVAAFKFSVQLLFLYI